MNGVPDLCFLGVVPRINLPMGPVMVEALLQNSNVNATRAVAIRAPPSNRAMPPNARAAFVQPPALTLVGTCGAKMKVQPVVNVHYLFWERAKSRQFCGGISLQIGCVTGLQALPIGPDMDVYMAGDCCGLI